MLMYDIEIFKRRPRFKNCVDCVCLCHYRNRGPQSDRDVRTKGQSCRRRAIEPPALTAISVVVRTFYLGKSSI